MKKNKFVSFLFGAGALMAVIGLFSFTEFIETDYSGEYQPAWENLKVLPQNISKDSLMDLMKGYNVALGVKCSHCHVPDKNDPKKMNFADDTKMAKNIARGMIHMTHEINENYFKPYYPDPKPHMVTDVSCVMCHRGTAKPKGYLEGLGFLYPKTEKDK